MCYIFSMKIKNIFINIDKLRFFVFPNLLVVYTYLQILFLFIYSQIGKTSIQMPKTGIAIENMFDFGVIFVSVLFSFFMIGFCLIMTFIECLLRKKINLIIINSNNDSILFNVVHIIVFYFGLAVVFAFILFMFYRGVF